MAVKQTKKSSRKSTPRPNWVEKLASKMKLEMKQEKKPREVDDQEKPAAEGLASPTPATEKSVPQGGVVLKKIPVKYDESDIRGRMKRFGVLKKVLLVRHGKLKAHLGTAFVYFQSTRSAENVMEKARKNCAECTETNTVPFVMLNEDKIECYEVSDRPPVSKRERPKEASDQKDRQDDSTGSRNLYLLMEGKVDDRRNDVSRPDMVKRRELYKVNIKKLRNPNFHMSKTRLSVHNIPLNMDEKDVKQLFKPFGRMRQVKLLRDKQNDFSKGCGFVEYADHSSALDALRGLNNNPDVWGWKTRPIVAFAIDNVAVVQKRRENLKKTTEYPENSRSYNE
ncbi:hypothetical protein XU18_0541 [Perkinsela sp. CCAP 1560/4]|nr:hypothetical protein XU18_0541 [Perkinsela sp. CCAP 1560/4]|eukprot:KNH09263.1 hypothetical protein XU18_0541 [Perkinsela sp. CCAP 1560/4]